MKLASVTIALAVAALAGPVAATAQTVAPEPAPPAQQAAPPDKVGEPLHARQPPSANIKRPETTGAAVLRLLEERPNGDWVLGTFGLHRWSPLTAPEVTDWAGPRIATPAR